MAYDHTEDTLFRVRDAIRHWDPKLETYQITDLINAMLNNDVVFRDLPWASKKTVVDGSPVARSLTPQQIRIEALNIAARVLDPKENISEPQFRSIATQIENFILEAN